MEITKIALDVSKSIKKYVKQSISGLVSRIDEVEKSLVDRDSIMALIKSEVASAVSEMSNSIPTPKDGKSVTVDDVRPVIKEAVQDAIDVAMASIKIPEDGRDAFEIDILSGIVEEKNYPRGVYATHNGGLWRSYTQTNGMMGWECIVNGVKSQSVEYNGERDAVIKTVLSDGHVNECAIKIPALLDKGVFRDGQIYEKGDGVTFGGSYWISLKDNPEGKPGSSDDFRLAVKRGRDAREVVKIGKKED